jgi:hypothetical protein
MEGAALQCAELIVSGYLSKAAYVLFKVCEHRLTHGIAGAPSAPDQSSPPERPSTTMPRA